jgi:recombination DNA repair RAD52 pathway protein
MVAPDNEADGHESAIKEAETDAMKRAFRTFGNTFGLALYQKDKDKREVARPPTTQDKVNAAKTSDDINAVLPEITALNSHDAKLHLHRKATELGLTFDTEAREYINLQDE